MIFANGEGVPKDFIEGLAWCNIAAADGTKSYVEHRDAPEKQIGVEHTLLAQKGSKQILEMINKIEPPATLPPPDAGALEKPKEHPKMSYKDYLAKHPGPLGDWGLRGYLMLKGDKWVVEKIIEDRDLDVS